MPTKRFTNLQQMGPIVAEVDAGGDVLLAASVATIADGGDATQGSIADPAVVTDAPGTHSGKLRGLVTLIVNLLSRWPAALGQTTKAGSMPVTLASDQGNLTVNMTQLQSQNISLAGDARSANSILPAGQQLYNGATSDQARAITTLKTAQSTATASGSALALWTPAVGKKFRLRALYGRASVLGRYEVRDGAATVIGYIYLDVNRWIEVLVLEANGHPSAAANNVLNIYNMSGVPADMDFIASGNEE